MDRERLTWMRLGAAAVDTIALCGAWVAVVYGRVLLGEEMGAGAGAIPWLKSFEADAHVKLLAVVVPLWIATLALRGTYRYLRRRRMRDVLGRLILSGALAMTVVVGVLFLLRVTWVSRVVVVGFALSSVPVLLLARAANLRLLHALRRSRFDPYRVLLMGQPDRAGPYLDALQRHPEWGMQVIGALAEPSKDTAARVEMLGPPNQLGALLVQQPVDEVYVVPGGLDPDALADVAQTCDEMGVRLSLDANFLGLRTAEPELSDFDGWSVLSFGPLQGAGPELVLKRTCDVVGSLLGLLFLWPLLLGVAICIKLEDRGSVFYVQQRAGRYGRLFSMVKFRSMRENADQEREALQSHNEMSGPAFKIADDPRITRVGKWIRRLSIDELPQLFNVVQGHMSLVGPRPPLPEEVAQYERWQLRRLSMRPGLTCIWQVSGRNEIDFERWMELDLQYIDNWSLWLDFRLIMRTVPAVLRGTGAR